MLKFASFTAPDGRTVAVVIDQIAAVRVADASVEHHAHAIIVFVSGGFQAVRETQAEVIAMLEAPAQPPSQAKGDAEA